jgi:hypothetical protein
VAIDPTAPLTPINPAAPAGSQPNSVVLQAMARAALANVTNTLGELVGKPSADAAKPHQNVEQADKASTQDAGRAAVSSSGGGASSAPAPRPPPQETRLMRAVRLAAADAVPRQAGLAPLMADVAAVLERLDTPPEVRSAAEALMARLPRVFEMSTPRGLRKAVAQSGVFLEARLARSGASTTGGAAPLAFPDTDLKAALLVFKGALSAWLARTTPAQMEELEHRLDTDSAAHESPEAAEVDYRVRTPASGAPSLPEQEAVAEAPFSPPQGLDPQEDGPQHAALAPGASKPQPPVATDEEAAPSAPAAAGRSQESPDDAVEPRFAAFLAPSKATPPAQSAKPTPTVLGLLDLADASIATEEGHPPAPTAAAPLAARGYGGLVADSRKPGTPPPPFADGPMAGQRPAVSALPSQATPDEIVRRLLKGAAAALARQDLMQIASLREVHHDPETGETRPQPARLNLDAPFVTPQGVAVAQFEITRDGGGGGAMVGPVERTYRVRFSIDVEPLGAVHALITLTGARARVSLWAERAETIARLRAGEEALSAALRQAELTPEVAVHSGPPPVKDARALGHFVDQAS